MKHSKWSHCAGEDIIAGPIQDEISSAIGAVKVKTAKGAATAIRDGRLKVDVCFTTGG